MTAWLMLALICTEPVPPECIGNRDPDAFMSRPMCVAVSKSCTIYEERVEVDAALDPKAALYVCLDRYDELLAEKRREGYARGRPECSPRRNGP